MPEVRIKLSVLTPQTSYTRSQTIYASLVTATAARAVHTRRQRSGEQRENLVELLALELPIELVARRVANGEAVPSARGGSSGAAGATAVNPQIALELDVWATHRASRRSG
jgi:hypothetical protein